MNGADKVAINTAAHQDENLISDIARRYGSQCCVVSIEAKAQGQGWTAYTDNGREHTGKDVIQWAKRAELLGAGEILLTSVDREGTRRGFDIPLIKSVMAEVSIPVIASGGCGSAQDIANCYQETRVDALAIADILHFKRDNVQQIKQVCAQKGVIFRD